MRRAFTIIELLVVISIMILLLVLSVSAFMVMTKGNNQTQAANLLTSLLANARATAIAQHRVAGLVVFQSPSNSGSDSAQIILSVHSGDVLDGLTIPDNSPTYFRPASRSQYLPVGVRVAALDDAAGFRVAGGRVVLFAENGQLVTMDNLARYPTLTDPDSGAWSISTSCPALVVYDGNALADSGAAAAPWILSHGTLLSVNAYTGNFIR